MVNSRIPAAIDAIVAALVAAGVKTWDGPVVTGDVTAAVYVGYDGNPDGPFLAVVGTQDWDGLGAKRRRETFTVTCAAVSLSGESTTKTGRDDVFVLFETVGTVLRNDPSVGGQAPPFVAELKPVELFHEPTTSGLQTRLVFTIDVQTRV